MWFAKFYVQPFNLQSTVWNRNLMITIVLIMYFPVHNGSCYNRAYITRYNIYGYINAGAQTRRNSQVLPVLSSWNANTFLSGVSLGFSFSSILKNFTQKVSLILNFVLNYLYILLQNRENCINLYSGRIGKCILERMRSSTVRERQSMY